MTCLCWLLDVILVGLILLEFAGDNNLVWVGLVAYCRGLVVCASHFVCWFVCFGLLFGFVLLMIWFVV